MKPAWSVIFLTTLLGAGQGLFLALFGTELLGQGSAGFFAGGAIISLVLLAGGLTASFFHLGRPERAWRAAAMWRTSWLSREVIVLPAFMIALAAWGALHYYGAGSTMLVGLAAAVLCLTLFLCTAMIYACVRFLQEWHTPLTVVNYTVLGSASGFVLAAALAAAMREDIAPLLSSVALFLTLLGFATRGASLARNARLRPRSTLQTALGVKHPRIAQKAQGAIAGSFNTREFFHGKPAWVVKRIQWGFLALAFVVPLALILAGWLALAFIVQYAGLLAERWFFFAQANHPQNRYYQAVS